ncbi:transcriptional regulator [Mycobacteroides abscessus subsp. massiliense]|nr:transcriptional regulator [Mycobacteroides abscessus subsp. massiliense]
MTIVSLQSVTATLESELSTTEFVVLPIFGRDRQPEYQIQIHLGQNNALSLQHLNETLERVQARLVPAL